MVAALIVGVLAGLGSGLLGSIIGPQLSHRLDRQRRAEVRQEERNRELRLMVERMMRLARLMVSSSVEVRLAVIASQLPLGAVPGPPPEDRLSSAWVNHRAELRGFREMYPDFTWLPSRIHDTALHEAVMGLNAEQFQLSLLIVERYYPTDAAALATWEARVIEQAAKVDTLYSAVDARMDQLGW
jgi:hypothetical protein